MAPVESPVSASYYVPTKVASVKSRQNEFVKKMSRILDEPKTAIASIEARRFASDVNFIM